MADADPTMPTTAEPPLDGQAVLTVDLDALVANWRALSALAAPAECAAVVKADAYGTGIERTVPALARAGCRSFFTAHVSEAVRARGALRQAGFADKATRIFVLNGFHAEVAPFALYAEAALHAVVGSLDELRAWTQARLASNAGLGCALHVDTGMNRYGFGVDDALGLEQADIDASGAVLLMSHFVSSEVPDEPLNGLQVARFEAARLGVLGRLPGSLANSSGLFLPGHPVYGLTRPGYALYGGNPTPGRPNPMRSVVSLHAPLLQTRWVEAGQGIGYNGRWVAERRSRIGTIGVGYADGLPRNARSLGGQDGGPAPLVGGLPCRLVGRVSMDLSLIDLTDVSEPDCRPGSLVELLGPSITVDDFGHQCGTIGYEILTSLGRRYRRHYKEAALV